jgi:polysaccharide export outer membrane protein
MRRFATVRAHSFICGLRVFLIVAIASGASGQSALPSPVHSPDQPSSTSERPVAHAVVIGGGDLLKVSILGAPESDQEVRVAEDGNISLSFIGSVHVGGLTTSGAQELIAKKLVAGGFFTDPQVSVFAKEYATQGVSVLGEVQKPGVYPLLGARRLFDVLSIAGGTTARAGKVVSITRRESPDTPRSILLSNDANESARSNIEVFAGDTVLVSRAGVVYVSGDVHKPGGVIMDNSSEMTVLQAMAMAEGANPTAALNKAKLIRRTPKGPIEMPLALKSMFASKAPDVPLQAEDIIFVPNSAAKSAGKRSLDAIIQAATGLAIYAH